MPRRPTATPVRSPLPVRAPATVTPIRTPTISPTIARNPIFGPLAQQIVTRSTATSTSTAPTAPAVPPAPVRGTIARPVATLPRTPLPGAIPIVRAPGGAVPGVPQLSPIGGTPLPVALRPAGSSLRIQPTGAPPSGAPPSMSMVTNQAGLPGGSMFAGDGGPVMQLGQFNLPLGWLALGAVALIVFLVARN